MYFPKTLDTDDMDLATKEWKLSGWHVDCYKAIVEVGEVAPGAPYLWDWCVRYQRLNGVWQLYEETGL